MRRIKFEMAAVAAWLEGAGETGMSAQELRTKTALEQGVIRALHHLKKEGWVKKAGDGKYALTPDQLRRMRSLGSR